MSLSPLNCLTGVRDLGLYFVEFMYCMGLRSTGRAHGLEYGFKVWRWGFWVTGIDRETLLLDDGAMFQRFEPEDLALLVYSLFSKTSKIPPSIPPPSQYEAQIRPN